MKCRFRYEILYEMIDDNTVMLLLEFIFAMSTLPFFFNFACLIYGNANDILFLYELPILL